jgi:hypothetical protein
VLVQVQQKITFYKKVSEKYDKIQLFKNNLKKVTEWSKVIDCKSIELFYMGSNPILLNKVLERIVQ